MFYDYLIISVKMIYKNFWERFYTIQMRYKKKKIKIQKWA